MQKIQLGELCYPVACDVSDLKLIPWFDRSIIKKFGQIDILVNNAGINMKKEFTEVTDEEFQKIITTNLCSVFAISREVVKQMLLQKSGSIINISSMAAQYGLPKVIAYSASKTAIDGMTRAMAVELSPKGIRVNAIAPGFIVTAMTDTALNADPERKEKVFNERRWDIWVSHLISATRLCSWPPMHLNILQVLYYRLMAVIQLGFN